MSAVKIFNTTFKAISQSLIKLQEEISATQLEEFIKVLIFTFHLGRKVFVYGEGRSLLVGKAFSMRLMHMGFKSYVIGEVVTPAVGVKDIFLVISKNLTDGALLLVAEMAENLGARVILITSSEDSSKLKKAGGFILIPDLKSSTTTIPEVQIPLGTLFEISATIVLDCVVGELMYRLGITEVQMEKRHANIQ